MGFGGALGLVPAQNVTANRQAVSDETLHSMECRACPLNRKSHVETLISPKMKASGDDEPEVYIIGEAPGRIEDEEGIQFVGPSGDLLRPHIPKRYRKRIRWNNTTRCRPPNTRNPDRVEIECCRPSIERDIEQSQPIAIFGLGGVPLGWAGKAGGIYLWRGRRFPIQIGSHTCWYYPMLHPAGILHKKSESNRKYQSDDEFAFEMDLKHAFSDIDDGLPPPVVHTPKFARENITCLTGRSSGDLQYLLEFLDYAGTRDIAGVDYETQNLRPYNKDSEILTAAVSVEDETVAFAFRHPQAGWTQSQLVKIDQAWVSFLSSRARKAVHQLSFEMEWTCFFYGKDLARVPWEDTMTQAYVIDERVGDVKPGALSLEWLTQQYFGINIKKLSPKMNKARMRDEDLETLLPYNGIDAKYHRLVYSAQAEVIRKQRLAGVYEEKVRQVPTVVLTQLKGVPVDPVVNKQLSKEYTRKLKEAEDAVQVHDEAKQFYKLTNEKFNPASPQHVIVVLRDILKTREGQLSSNGWSTKESVLKQVDHPFTDSVLAFRKVQKIKGTYVDPYSPGSPVLYPGNIIHTNLGTCFTETGRLNSEDPNIQNVPIRTDEGKKARKQIASRIVASFDYGQIDARIIACGSRDKYYCKALWENYDIHLEWAERLAYEIPRLVGGKANIKDPEKMDKFRNRVKSQWVFALFYGAALRTTAGRFEVEMHEIEKLYNAFWKQFADVKKWQDRISDQFKEHGYVQLFDGLRRHAPLGRGQQINTPVQGATNRIVMLGMNRLSEKEDNLLQANMQIHDDLTFCFNDVNDYEDSVPRILDTMLDGREFDWFCVPLVVDLKDGRNWAEMKKIGTFSSVERLGWPQRAKEFT